MQVLEVSLRGSFNEQNIEPPQRLLRVTKKIFTKGWPHESNPNSNNTNNVRKTIGMIHRTTKKPELYMRKEPQLPMKENRSRNYMRRMYSKTNWLSWTNRYDHRVVLRTAAPTQIV